MCTANPTFFKFDLQTVARACSLTLRNAGIKIPISTAMMAITTSSSINVNPLGFRLFDLFSKVSMASSFKKGGLYLEVGIGPKRNSMCAVLAGAPTQLERSVCTTAQCHPWSVVPGVFHRDSTQS